MKIILGEYAHGHSQLPPSPLTVYISHQIKMRAIWNTTLMSRGSVWIYTNQ